LNVEEGSVLAPAASEASVYPEQSAAAGLERLAERLRDTEQRFQGWFDDAPIACHEIDQNGIVLRANRVECELLGVELHQMLGRHIWDFMSPEEGERSQEVVGLLVSGLRPPLPFEREYTRQDGTRLVVEIHPKLIRDAAGRVTGIRSFRLDITARKRAEKALQEQAEKLVRSNAELEQFAYVASHDLQEPLRKIQAFGDRLKSKCGPELNSDAQDCLKRVQNAAARMQTLIQDLLSLSRVSSQTQPFVSVDLNELARAVISDLEIRIEQLGAHVEVAALPVVIGDRIQLAQLFLNLIGNALKFHKPGEPPWVKLWSERDQGQTDVWRIVIEDQGIGFDEKYLDRIFQIFQRLHGRTEYEGTGIGLAICSKIVDRHHGVITASSKPGEGAKFVVTLPCKSSRGEACNE
jgi:PAS domain S-box-containing protein